MHRLSGSKALSQDSLLFSAEFIPEEMSVYVKIIKGDRTSSTFYFLLGFPHNIDVLGMRHLDC